MKHLLTILLLLSTFSAFSQTDTEKPKGFEVELIFSPDLYLNSTAITKGESIGYTLEPSGFSFTTGLTSRFPLNSNLDLGMGVQYSKKSYAGTFYCHVCDFAVPPQPEPIKLQYLEIPLSVRYKILNKKLGIHAETGLLGSYLLDDDIDTWEVSAGKFLLSAQLGFGVNFEVGNSVSLSLTPTYRHSFTDFSDTNTKFRYISFITGLAFKL